MELADPEVWEVSKPRKNGSQMYATVPKRWRKAVMDYRKAMGLPASDLFNMPLLFFGFEDGKPVVKLIQ